MSKSPIPYLSGLKLGPIAYFETIGSTNSLATSRLAAGAPDLSIIISDEQTSGRGRMGRSWHTPPGAALALSIILHTQPDSPTWAYAPLGALAVHDALLDLGLHPKIKWPNDVLVNGSKVCGILAEAHWQGNRLQGIVLGIGVNILPEAVPETPLNFPATSVSAELGRAVDRWLVLSSVLKHLLTWRSMIGQPSFLSGWENRLAYKGELVTIGSERGRLSGLSPEGGLRLQTAAGEKIFPAGELSLRPAEK